MTMSFIPYEEGREHSSLHIPSGSCSITFYTQVIGVQLCPVCWVTQKAANSETVLE